MPYYVGLFVLVGVYILYHILFTWISEKIIQIRLSLLSIRILQAYMSPYLSSSYWENLYNHS